MPIKHVVMFAFKPEVTSEQINALRQELLNLPTVIPQILSYELGDDLRYPSGQEHPLGPNRNILWSVTVSNAQDYQIYNDCEAHQKVLQSIKKILAPGTRAAIQYEVA